MTTDGLGAGCWYEDVCSDLLIDPVRLSAEIKAAIRDELDPHTVAMPTVPPPPPVGELP